jgi:GGDEF domain-containing protein
MIEDSSIRRLGSWPVPRLILLLLTLLLNVVLAWIASDISLPGLAVLICVLSAIEAALWFRLSAPRMSESSPADEPRLTTLYQRTAQARRSAVRDEATGLHNRWYLDMRLEEEGERCRRYGLSMAVVVLRTGVVGLGDMSMDGWQEKSAEIAQKTLEVIRKADLSACLAPFEFAVCLVHCDKAGADRAVERLKAQLEDYECDAGIALFPEDDCEPRALIELARVRSRGHLLPEPSPAPSTSPTPQPSA